jgi:hypothetical protein
MGADLLGEVIAGGRGALIEGAWQQCILTGQKPVVPQFPGLDMKKARREPRQACK